MAEHNLEEILADIITKVKDARSDDVVTFNEAMGVGMLFIAGVTHVVKDLQNEDDMEDLIEECQGIFDEYLRPLDIKAIPNFLERFVDNFIFDSVEGGIRSLYYFIHEAE